MEIIDTSNTKDAEAIEIFKEFLENNGFRKTPERFAILSEIYHRNDHFDAEALYVHMKKSDYHVSRATVYNTLDILSQCNLIAKHHFDGHVTRYEKTYGVPAHDHMICTKCGKITEFRDERIEAVRKDVAANSDMEVTGHALIVYGECKDDCTTGFSPAH